MSPFIYKLPTLLYYSKKKRKKAKEKEIKYVTGESFYMLYCTYKLNFVGAEKKKKRRKEGDGILEKHSMR